MTWQASAAAPSHRGETIEVAIPADVVRAIEACARERAVSTFATWLAAFSIVLRRHSGSADFVVGTPVSLCDRVRHERVAGLAVNTLPIRVRTADDPSFDTLVRRVHAQVLAAHAHKAVPFDQIVDRCQVRREPGASPLVQVMFQYDPDGDIEIPGLWTTPVPLHTSTAKFDLTLALRSTGAGGGQWWAQLEFKPSLSSHAAMTRLATHVLNTSRAATASPDRRISAIEMLSPDERTFALHTFQSSGHGGGPARHTNVAPRADDRADDEAIDLGASLHGPIEEQARQRGDAAALVCVDHRQAPVSYGELDRRANALARRLIALGATAETRVAVAIERSSAALIAILGVLKSGAAFVPIAPADPLARLRLIVTDARALAIVTTRELADDLAGLDRPCVLIDDDDATTEDAVTPPGVAIDGRQLAYVLYTSGSTGTPKGVLVAHRSAAAYIRWAVRAYGITASTIAPLHTALQFDLTLTTIFAPLWAGGTIAIVSEDQPLDAAPDSASAGSVSDGSASPARGFGLIKLTPAHLRRLDATRVDADVVVVGGEALATDMVPGRWRRVVVNEYGPTEATVACAAYWMTGREQGAVPIGRSVAGARLYVLGPDLELLPRGVDGEICIGGDGLARGYANQPALTARAFVPDPFGAPGARLYRTGDVGRINADGDLEFRGRHDAQVKIDGVRVELGEIEAVLRSHPGIRDAVAVAQRHADGTPTTIAAWVVPSTAIAQADASVSPAAAAPDAASIADWLRTRLPFAFLPGTLMVIETLPISANGKVDVSRLPESPRDVRPRRETFTPSNDTEAAIAAIWADLLGQPPIGDFFDAGGQSLLAVRFASRLSHAFDLHVSTRDVFEQPTVAGLAARIDRRRTTRAAHAGGA